MGTSKGYRMPTGGDWTPLKTEATNFVKDGGHGSVAPEKLLSDYLKVNGGAKFIARAGSSGKAKFITLHSRQAETEVLDILEQENRSPVVFHWFSGSQSNLRRLLADGHFCSVNPAMLDSPNGNKIIDALPPDRVLTETDGPFIRIGKRAILPHDVGIVEDNLRSRWQMNKDEVRARIRENFLELVRPLRQPTEPRSRSG